MAMLPPTQQQEAFMNATQDLVERYVAVWNETDADARRAAIARLWRPDGAHFGKERETKGHAGLEQRDIGSVGKNAQGRSDPLPARGRATRLPGLRAGVCWR